MNQVHFVLIPVLIAIWFGISTVAYACDSGADDNGNTITCDAGNTPSDDTVNAQGGDDNITVEDGATVTFVGGDTDPGPALGAGDGGDDTIIVEGEATYVYGDGVTDDGGDDTIIINGEAGEVVGDTNYGDGGDDTIIINGEVTTVVGDNSAGEGGDDTIIINGEVTDVVADYSAGAGGDDTVVITENAVVNGTIDGDEGQDTLEFRIRVNNRADYRNLAGQIANANPAGGSVTHNGNTYNWANFEELVDALIDAFGTGGGGGEVTFRFDDPRLNYMDAGQTAAVYCEVNGGVTLLDVQGNLLFSVDWQTIADSLAQASADQSHVMIQAVNGQSLWALNSGLDELQLHDDAGHYDFIFKAQVCQPLTIQTL